MKVKALVILFATVLATGCHSKTDDANLVGSWEPITPMDDSGMDIREEILFNDQGEYRAITRYKDSIVYEVDGAYQVHTSGQSMEVTFTAIKKNGELQEPVLDTTYSIKIIELSDSTLILESTSGTFTYTKKDS